MNAGAVHWWMMVDTGWTINVHGALTFARTHHADTDRV